MRLPWINMFSFGAEYSATLPELNTPLMMEFYSAVLSKNSCIAKLSILTI